MLENYRIYDKVIPTDIENSTNTVLVEVFKNVQVILVYDPRFGNHR